MGISVVLCVVCVFRGHLMNLPSQRLSEIRWCSCPCALGTLQPRTASKAVVSAAQLGAQPWGYTSGEGLLYWEGFAGLGSLYPLSFCLRDSRNIKYFLFLLPFSVIPIHRTFLWFPVLYHPLLKILALPASSHCHSCATTAATVQPSFCCSSS